MNRCLAALAGLVVLAGCAGRRSETAGAPSPSAAPRPSVTALSPAPPSPSPPAASSRAAPASPAGLLPSPDRPPKAPPPQPPAPAPAAPSDQVRQPAPGDYVYDLSGASTGLSGTTEPYPKGATQTVRVGPAQPVPGGAEFEAVQTSPEEPDVVTAVRSRWEAGRVLLVSTLIRIGALSNYPCVYNPAPEVLRLPPVAETRPAQSFGGDCSGTMDVTVAGPEEVTAAGRVWHTWKVRTKSTFTMGVGLTGTLDTTSWIAPELGQPVRGETALDAQLLTTRLSARQTTVLRSHP